MKQCKFVTKHDSCSFLCCALEDGHPGAHIDSYDKNRVWMLVTEWQAKYNKSAAMVYQQPRSRVVTKKIAKRPNKK